MTLAFLACAATTAISALVSLGFSIAAVRSSTGQTRTIAFYAGARSAALAITSLVPFFTGSVEWLLAVALCMIIVQAADAVIGTTIRDAMKTYGPAATSVVNIAAVIWLLQTLA